MHRAMASGHRGSKWHPAGYAKGDGTWPGISFNTSRVPVNFGTAFKRPLVYGCFGFEKMSSRDPASTILAAYITRIRSHISQTTPISWVISSMEVSFPFHRPDQIKNLGLGGHIQGRGGLIRNDQLRRKHECHGNHNPLLHPAGKLKRICVHPLRGIGNAHFGQPLFGIFPGGPFPAFSGEGKWLQSSAGRSGEGETTPPTVPEKSC